MAFDQFQFQFANRLGLVRCDNLSGVERDFDQRAAMPDFSRLAQHMYRRERHRILAIQQFRQRCGHFRREVSEIRSIPRDRSVPLHALHRRCAIARPLARLFAGTFDRLFKRLFALAVAASQSQAGPAMIELAIRRVEIGGDQLDRMILPGELRMAS